jgi:hypothetical protein
MKQKYDPEDGDESIMPPLWRPIRVFLLLRILKNAILMQFF